MGIQVTDYTWVNNSKSIMSISVCFILFILLKNFVEAEETCQQEASKVCGDLVIDENWKYLTNYCFLSQHGKFEYDVSYEAKFGTINIGLYYDTVSQWNRVYGDTADLKTCEEKASVLKPQNNQIIQLTPDLNVSGCKIVNDTISGKDHIHCRGSINFNTARPRWWYFTVFDCKSTEGLQFSYKFTMTNGHYVNDDEIVCKNGGQKLQSYFLLLIGSWMFAILTF